MAIGQPMSQVVPILRQISGSIEEAMQAFSNQTSLPHTPQVHPQPSHTHITQDLPRPYPRSKEEKEEINKKLIVDEDDHKGPLPRPTVTAAPLGGVITDFGPCIDSPVTVAPTSFFNSSMTNSQHNNRNHKIVPLGTQVTNVLQSTAQEDIPNVPERRLPAGGSPTVAIYHHRNRSDTMTPLI